MSGVEKLLKVLQQRSQRKQSDHHKEKLSKSREELTEDIIEHKKQPWRYNSSPKRKIELLPLKSRCLDNWEILRTNLSDRSYEKNYKGLKIPAKGREFVHYNSKDKDGHLPYLYEADFAKFSRIQSSVTAPTIKKVNTAQNHIFGMAKSKQRRNYDSVRISRIESLDF